MWASWSDFQKWIIDWVKYLSGQNDKAKVEIAALRTRMDKLEQGMKTMSVEFENMKAAYEANKAEVLTAVSSLKDKVAALQAAVDASDRDAIVALTAEITTDTASLHASVSPTDAQPGA